jgi:hypothetical protein
MVTGCIERRRREKEDKGGSKHCLTGVKIEK